VTQADISAPVRVLIVDDDPIVRRSLTRLVAHTGASVIGVAADGSLAIAAVREHRPELVLMDVSMPVIAGPAATEEILRLVPGTRVIAMTSLGTEEALTSMISAGAQGFLVKDRVFDEIEQAIDAVMAGEGFASPRATAQLIRRASAGSDDAERRDARERFAALSPREQEVARLVADGSTNPQIGDRLFVSTSTVKTHLEQIQAKLGVAGRTHIAILVDRAGHGPALS